MNCDPGSERKGDGRSPGGDIHGSAPVRFGIIGVGRIAVRAFAPALRAAVGGELFAAASRDLGRARSLGPVRAYDRYESLLDDGEVEAVYIATHNGLHHSLTLAALERGKHVLCEKPLACNPAECAEMIAAAREHGRVLVEAFMYRHHPQIVAVREMISRGEIGRIVTVEAAFSGRFSDESDVRFVAAWGGGALLDMGCYCVNACRLLLEGMPAAVTAHAAFHPHRGVDTSLHGVLDFGEGRFGLVSCGFDGGPRNRVTVCGTDGALTLSRAFANNREPTTLIVEAGGQRRELAFDATDVFRLEIEDFVRAVRGVGEPLLDAEEGLRNAQVMEALRQSARDGGRPTPVRC
jgi:D-xylose 1-dehydrogenase (NADP+, D-xylono-1,5-lactone-forming)